MGSGFLSRWALPVSLALNVFLATVLVMREPHLPPHPHGGPGGGPPGPPPSPLQFAERLMADLPPADAAILRGAVARRSRDVEMNWQTWTGLPGRVAAMLAAPTYDSEALRAALAEGRDAHRVVDDVMAEVVIEAAAAMSPEARQAVARWRPGPPGHRGPPPPR